MNERREAPESARNHVLERFGERTRIAEATRHAWGGSSVRATLDDLKWALRSLRRAPAFTAMAILVIALGIGATTAVFSVVNAVLLRPLPYYDASRLVAITSIYRPDSDRRTSAVVRLTDVEAWGGETRSLASLGAFAYTQLPIRVGDRALSPVTALMDPQFLRVLGVPLALDAFSRQAMVAGTNTRSSCRTGSGWTCLAATLRRSDARCWWTAGRTH